MEIINIIILCLSGLFLTLIGALRLSNPIKNYSKNSGINLPNETDLLSEIRGISALMLLGGIIILSGAIIHQLILVSFMVAILIFFGFAIGRIVSIYVDGKPNKQITQGIKFEIVFTLINVFGLINSLP